MAVYKQALQDIDKVVKPMSGWDILVFQYGPNANWQPGKKSTCM